MIKSILHRKIIERMPQICSWYNAQTLNLNIPIYSSYDIRDSGKKIVNVDGNIFPAGFNNICPTDKESAVDILNQYLNKKYGSKIQKIMLVTEEHTNNPYYWDNIYTIKSLIEETQRKVIVAIPQKMEKPLTLISASMKTVEVYSAYLDTAGVKEFAPDLIISNNDFTEPYEEWIQSVSHISINPPHALGWHQRKKSNYFKHYNRLAEEFAHLIDINPMHITVDTELFQNFDIGNEDSRSHLASQVDIFLKKLETKNKALNISDKPFAFVKNNSGTYGLAVIKVNSGEEVKQWTYKSRKKMKASKGGRDVEEVIIQEGVPSIVQSDGASAEPVIYMIGCQLAGGFLRAHAEKSGTESLNSPGAVYKRMCVTDLQVDTNGCTNENVYGWTGKLGLLAIANEAKDLLS